MSSPVPWGFKPELFTPNQLLPSVRALLSQVRLNFLHHNLVRQSRTIIDSVADGLFLLHIIHHHGFSGSRSFNSGPSLEERVPAFSLILYFFFLAICFTYILQIQFSNNIIRLTSHVRTSKCCCRPKWRLPGFTFPKLHEASFGEMDGSSPPRAWMVLRRDFLCFASPRFAVNPSDGFPASKLLFSSAGLFPIPMPVISWHRILPSVRT